jgi:hypothetical protein
LLKTSREILNVAEGPVASTFANETGLQEWWPGTESVGQEALKTGKLLIFQRP